MAKKLLFFFGLLLVMIVQPACGYSAFLISRPVAVQQANKITYARPGSHHSFHSHSSCHSYHYHTYHHNDHFLDNFFREKDKNWASWSLFFDYFLIGPVGTACGAIGLMRHNQGAGLGLGIGIIESALEIACFAF